MSNESFGGNEYEQFGEEGQYGGIFDGVTDNLINKVLDKLGIKQEQVDKVKRLIDMVDFTKIDGDRVMIVKVGDNIEVRITV